MDAAGQLLVDLEDLPDVAPLPEAEAMTSLPSWVIAWTLPSAESGWPPRTESYGPPSLIASAMPVSSSVTEVLVIPDAPRGMCARTASRAPSKSSTTSTRSRCARWTSSSVMPLALARQV